MQLTIGSRPLNGPVLIPSISRFETQATAEDAIALQHALREPITLVSAHDTFDKPDFTAQVDAFRADGGLVFLDSGGYEASRIARYVKDYHSQWDFERFRAACQQCECDLIASFDLFIAPDDKPDEYQYKMIDFLTDHDFIAPEKLVPVLHFKDYSGTKYLSADHSVDLVDRVAVELSPAFIAIPERELGDGLAAKRRLIKSIVEKLQSRGSSTKIHVLGCGNPLSFAVLSDAGIAMADGLEWCRTLVGPNYHLHHFQQGELFREPDPDSYNPLADLIREHVGSYRATTLARNLFALQRFSERLGQALEAKAMAEFISENFGLDAANLLKDK